MNQYRILRQLRKSNWIQSYLAVEKEKRRQVVLKFVVHPQAQESDWYSPFQQRLTAVQRLSQQQPDLPLAAIYGWGRLSDPHEAGEETIPAGVPYFVLEYIEGETLADMMAEFSVFPLRLASDIVDTIAAALDKIHAAGLTHGNLKPNNILIGADDKLVLTDFHLTPSGGFLMNVGEQLTQDEASYVSPEQTQSARAVNQRSDIYNLGLLLFEMVTGERPFRGPSTSRLLRQHAFDAPPSARRLNSELPTAVDLIVEKALAKNDLARYATAGEMAAALRQILAEAEPPAKPPPPLFPPPVVVPVTSMAPDPLTTVTVMEQAFLEEEPSVKPKAASQASPAPPASQASPTAAGRPSNPPLPASQGQQVQRTTARRPATSLVPIVIAAGLVVVISACILMLALISFRAMSAAPETGAPEATPMATTPMAAAPTNGESLSLEELLLGSVEQSLPPSGPQALIEIGRYGEGKVEAITVVSQGAAVAVSGPAGVALYDMTDLSPMERLFSSPIEAIAWLDDGRFLATPSRESSVSVINIWDSQGQFRQQLNTGEYSGITQMAAPERGEQLAVLQAGNLQIWSTQTGT
jgi:serine/threonine protein kinase